MMRTTETSGRHAGLYEHFSWLEDSKDFARNPALHGKSLGYATKANAIRALLALDAIYWITGFQFRRPEPMFVGPGDDATDAEMDGELWEFDP